VLERPGLDAGGHRVAAVVRAGFTIIELLVVVVILGLLALALVFTVGGSDGDSQQHTCAAEKARVENAIKAYRAQTGEFPQAMGDLTMEPTRFLRFLPTYYVLAADRSSGEIEGTGPCAGE
jgi:prepilin-type N-terminal cleavage/methylation domain-containing protein